MIAVIRVKISNVGGYQDYQGWRRDAQGCGHRLGPWWSRLWPQEIMILKVGLMLLMMIVVTGDHDIEVRSFDDPNCCHRGSSWWSVWDHRGSRYLMFRSHHNRGCSYRSSRYLSWESLFHGYDFLIYIKTYKNLYNYIVNINVAWIHFNSTFIRVG